MCSSDLEQGGFVCNIAITRYATATVRADETYPSGGEKGAPTDPLVAAALKRTGAQRLAVELRSDFPVGAGLAGGSSDAAATLAGLARLVEKPVSKKDLSLLGEALGSDVPFFFNGPGAWVWGVGQHVMKVPSPKLCGWYSSIRVLRCPRLGPTNHGTAVTRAGRPIPLKSLKNWD